MASPLSHPTAAPNDEIPSTRMMSTDRDRCGYESIYPWKGVDRTINPNLRCMIAGEKRKVVVVVMVMVINPYNYVIKKAS